MTADKVHPMNTEQNCEMVIQGRGLWRLEEGRVWEFARVGDLRILPGISGQFHRRVSVAGLELTTVGRPLLPADPTRGEAPNPLAIGGPF
jgi:hypothetical protein